MTRRLEDVYAQLAADREHQARLVAELVLSRAWDEAATAARKYYALNARCDQIITGTAWVEGKVSTSVE